MNVNLCMGCMQPHEGGRFCPHCGFNESNYEVPPHHLPPKTILNGKYLVGKALGEGGFGITYLGWDLNLELKVAIKEYYPNGFVTRSFGSEHSLSVLSGYRSEYFRKGLDQFIDEARRLAKFWSLPGIVTVKDYFPENKTAYIVMEFVEGETLKHILKENGRMEPERVFHLMEPLMDSLEMVHNAGLIHRDISPDNLMITPSGTIKLLDFGAARNYLANTERSLSVILKPGYSPEEQYRSRGSQGPWTDVYGLCATMYRAITGQVPTESLDRMAGETLPAPSSLGIQIPDYQEAALMKGLAVFQKDRYQSIRELLTDLQTNPADMSSRNTDNAVEDTLYRNTSNMTADTSLPNSNNNIRNVTDMEDKGDNTETQTSERSFNNREAAIQKEPVSISEENGPIFHDLPAQEEPANSFLQSAFNNKKRWILGGAAALIILVLLIKILSGGNSAAQENSRSQSPRLSSHTSGNSDSDDKASNDTDSDNETSNDLDSDDKADDSNPEDKTSENSNTETANSEDNNSTSTYEHELFSLTYPSDWTLSVVNGLPVIFGIHGGLEYQLEVSDATTDTSQNIEDYTLSKRLEEPIPGGGGSIGTMQIGNYSGVHTGCLYLDENGRESSLTEDCMTNGTVRIIVVTRYYGGANYDKSIYDEIINSIVLAD